MIDSVANHGLLAGLQAQELDNSDKKERVSFISANHNRRTHKAGRKVGRKGEQRDESESGNATDVTT